MFLIHGLLSGNEQLILAAVIRHLDHKNVANDPGMKSDIIQIGSALAQQLRSQDAVTEIGVVSDLCRHLRKSLQATVEVVGKQESDWNASLQNSIEDCMLEIVKGVRSSTTKFIVFLKIYYGFLYFISWNFFCQSCFSSCSFPLFFLVKVL